MVTLEQLRHLLAVVDHGTLSAAAEELHISQPALSRSMQRLERELGTSLFERSPNRLEATEAARMAAGHARAILDRTEALHREAMALERRRTTIDVLSCAPEPLWRLQPLVEQELPERRVASKIVGLDEVDAAVASGKAQIGITTRVPRALRDRAMPWGTEHLRVSVPPAHPAAGRSQVSLHDLDGQTILLLPRLGFWGDLVRFRMPRSRLIVHDDATWTEIARSSTLPVFTTDLVRSEDWGMTDRVDVPISDPEAHPVYWCILADDPALRGLAEALRARAGS